MKERAAGAFRRLGARASLIGLLALGVALALPMPASPQTVSESALSETWSRSAAPAPEATAPSSAIPSTPAPADASAPPASSFGAEPAAGAASDGAVSVPGDLNESRVNDAKLVVVPGEASGGNGALMQPASPPSTAVIPPASASGSAPAADDAAAYLSQGPAMAPHPGNLAEFLAQGGETMLPIGVELRESRRRVRAGGVADGLLVIDVRPGSPAAQAGVRPLRDTAHEVIQGVAALASVAASVVFPPAIMGMAAVGDIPGGESYDMIIGVDGSRVTNIVDLQDRLRVCQPGEIVYFNILRNGRRIQLPVQLPSTAPASD